MNRAALSQTPQQSRLAPAPVVLPCQPGLTPRQAARALADLPHLLLLESSMTHDKLGRYSFLMADPVDWFQPASSDLATTFGWLNHQLANFPVLAHPHLPPFQGGIAGLFGYEFNAAIERLPRAAGANSLMPVSLGIYDFVVAWDHEQDECHIIAQGFPETDPAHRQSRAAIRAGQIADRLSAVRPDLKLNTPLDTDSADEATTLQRERLASNFSRDKYLNTIQRALDYIHDGDIFQVNIAQQLVHPATACPLDLYECLATCNPATFAGYFDPGHCQIISASPERLVSVRDRLVETRPIKGTRRRTRRPEVDLEVGSQLKSSRKDRAENVMIVDLMRNDLSRICKDDSVRVTQFVELESYASVLHLVSAVEGTLCDDASPGDVLKALFPGGSITGAPKVRAMEIIAELEDTPRGAYCGSLGYFGFDGSIDLNILIRTITAVDGMWQFPVGGGIVADSEPAAEYEETWTKAWGMLQALSRLTARQTSGDGTP